MKKRGLGMGLSALLAGDDDEVDPAEALPERRPARPEEGLERLPIEFLRPSPFQPRRRFDEAGLEDLAASIAAKGILQPLVVRPDGKDGFEIIAGERRWRAAQRAGLDEVPAIVRRFGDREALEIALVENLQRADLNAVEEARAFERLMGEFGHTQDVLAEAVGKSRSHVANTLRLLRLPEDVRLMVEDGRLTAGHGRALLGTSDPVALAHVVVEKSLTVREVEALAAAPPAARPTPPPPDPDLLACEERLARHLGLRVSIRPKRKGGSLSIAYSSPDQLQSLLDRLGSG